MPVAHRLPLFLECPTLPSAWRVLFACEQAGAGIFYNGATSSSSLQLNHSTLASNAVDSPFTGSEGTNGLGGESGRHLAEGFHLLVKEA